MKINNLVISTLKFNSLVSLKYSVLILVSLLVLGCAQQPTYTLAISNTQIKQVQILDLNAPERNDGIIADLEGTYGRNLIKKYQRSIYDMKASRKMTQTSQ